MYECTAVTKNKKSLGSLRSLLLKISFKEIFNIANKQKQLMKLNQYLRKKQLFKF